MAIRRVNGPVRQDRERATSAERALCLVFRMARCPLIFFSMCGYRSVSVLMRIFQCLCFAFELLGNLEKQAVDARGSLDWDGRGAPTQPGLPPQFGGS